MLVCSHLLNKPRLRTVLSVEDQPDSKLLLLGEEVLPEGAPWVCGWVGREHGRLVRTLRPVRSVVCCFRPHSHAAAVSHHLSCAPR